MRASAAATAQLMVNTSGGNIFNGLFRADLRGKYNRLTLVNVLQFQWLMPSFPKAADSPVNQLQANLDQKKIPPRRR
jgi:hypothetical protein